MLNKISQQQAYNYTNFLVNQQDVSSTNEWTHSTWLFTILLEINYHLLFYVSFYIGTL